MYYYKYAQTRAPSNIKIESDVFEGKKGKCAFAVEPIPQGAVIVKEAPLVAIQHTANKAYAHVCAQCFTFVGGVNFQLANHFAGLHANQNSDSDDDSKQTSYIPTQREVMQLQQLQLPLASDFPAANPVLCKGGCHEVVYCSEECNEKAWSTWHSLLCPGEEGNSEIEAFYAHSDATNDVFGLAGQAVAKILLAANHNLKHLLEQESSKGRAINDLRWQALKQAWQPFAMGYKHLWWECIAIPSDVDDEDEFRQEIKELASDSLELLDALLRTKAPELVEAFPAVLDLRIYGSIIGMYELNNLTIYVPSPVLGWVNALDEAGDDAWDGVGAQSSKAARTVGWLREWLENEFNPGEWGCDGNGFYNLQSTINHSCQPNAHAFKRDIDTDGSAVILALRDIQPGEELGISYIDENGSYEERTSALADWGFTCDCAKCGAERPS